MSEEKKPKNNEPENHEARTIAVTVIVTLLAVAFIGGLIFAGKKYIDRKKELQALKQQMENLQKAPETTGGETTITGETPATETGADTNEYAGWKTYANSEIGYRLKYPADWTVKEISQTSEILGTPVKYITIASPGGKYFLFWGLKRKTDAFAISDRTGIGAGEPKKDGNIMILGKEYAINLFVINGRTEEIFYPNAGITQSADGKYEFVANFEEGAGTSSNLLDMADAPGRGLAEKILKSVALTEKTVSSSGCSQTFTNEENLDKADWKTVSNNKYGYSFQNPKSLTVGEKQDDYIGLGSGADQQSFEWRSGPMTGTDYYGFKEDSHKNMMVGCANAKITYFSGDPAADPPGDTQDRLVLVQFEKNGIPHVILFSYQYIGASISSDVVEMFELILKTVKFSK
ncbi:MAG: hypothetical protein PHP25_01535 [Candidatus Moranbacteria bacterium]|nr:hypothetical protein [Candidatus Moranbacteria bacterium]